MFVQVRRFDATHGQDETTRIDCRSFNERIDELKKKVADKFGAPLERGDVRMFFDGKELQDDYSVFHYGIKFSHVIQVLIREKPAASRLTDLPSESRSPSQPPHPSSSSPASSSSPDSSFSNTQDSRVDSHEVALEPVRNDAAIIGDAAQAVNSAEASDNGERSEHPARDVEFCDAAAMDDSPEPGQVPSDEFYSIGEFVDALHPDFGAWFEARVHRIVRPARAAKSIYYVRFIKSSLGELIPLGLSKIRPQSWRRLGFEEVSEGDTLLANFSLNQSDRRGAHDERGFWYDARVTRKDSRRKRLYATIFIGDTTSVKDQRLRFVNDPVPLYVIEPNVQRAQRGIDINEIIGKGSPRPRVTAAECATCDDQADVPCKECACKECGGKNAPESLLICDECEQLCHSWCLPQPLVRLPPEDEDWYCPSCKNTDDVEIARQEKEFRDRKASAVQRRGQGDWGRGMACVGRSQVCPAPGSGKDHFGPVTGVEVGSWWRFRFQASEAGLHTPLVAGICGKENIGASSIVVSCAYADDIDLGDEIYYTGSGGRESSEAKCRVGGAQTKDQQLKRCNKALAMCCQADFNEDTGANAGPEWRLGKPVRVLRSGNSRGAAKRSLYLPKGGVRYDGIYKVVKYWAQRSDATGLLVWRFLLRRDDPSPAPWTKEGKARTRRLGLDKMLEPPGWVDTKKQNRNARKKARQTQPVVGGAPGSEERHQKRKQPLDDFDDVLASAVHKRRHQCVKAATGAQDASAASVAAASAPEPESRVSTKTTNPVYRLPPEIDQLVGRDEANRARWEQLRHFQRLGREGFRVKVAETFRCVCCLDLLAQPITTRCTHNICKVCCERVLSIGDRNCPICRKPLLQTASHKSLKVNTTLVKILAHLFPLTASAK